MGEQWVRLVEDDPQGHVVHLVLDRPQARNAISLEMARQVAAATEELGRRPGLRAVVLRSSRDDAFCVGADLKERRDATARTCSRRAPPTVPATAGCSAWPCRWWPR